MSIVETQLRSNGIMVNRKTRTTKEAIPVIKYPLLLQEFEDDLIRKDKTDIPHKYRLLEDMYKEAVALSVFPLKNPLEGLDVDIRIAKVINSVPKSS